MASRWPGVVLVTARENARAIRDLRTETSERFGELRAETNERFKELRAETGERFGELRAEMDARFEKMDARFDKVDGDIAELRERMARVEGVVEGYSRQGSRTAA